MSDSSTVHALLLQEAQQEVASLRTELYNTRRTAEERRQAVGQLSSRVHELEGQVQSLEGSLNQCRAELAKLHGVDAELAALKETTQRLQRELEASTSARRILAGELADERQQRQNAEQAKATLESERSRLQKARAELAAQVRLAEKAAKDAEAEQLHAESEAQALRNEVAMLRAGSVTSPTKEGRHAADSQTSELLLELENERHRSAALIESLHAARDEAEALRLQAAGSVDGQAADALREQAGALRAEAAEAHARVRQLEQQLQASSSELVSARQAAAAAQAAAAEARSLAQAAASAQALVTSTQPLRPITREQPPMSSSDSLYALAAGGAVATSGGAATEAELLAQLDRYQAQVAKLKQSRDKLLEEIDSQWEEMDRLASEHRAALAEVATQRHLASTWETQAQDALGQVNRLKELLEESAAWGAGGGLAGEGLGGKSAAEVAVSLQTQLLREKARAAEMELGARALAAELVRAQHASVSIGRSVLPVLCGLEHRLGGMCDEAQDALRQWRQRREQQGAGAGAVTATQRAVS